MYRTLAVLAAVLFCSYSAYAQETAKRPLDHEVYDSWMRITEQQLSDDGAWILYVLEPQDGDGALHVRSLDLSESYEVPRGEGARFSDDRRFVVFVIKPELAAVRAAEQEDEDEPQDSLGVLDLSSGAIDRVERVKSFKLPEEAGGWLAYLLEKAEEEADTAEAAEEQPQEPAAEPEPEPLPEEPQAEEEEDEKKKDVGTTLVLRDLETGEERRFENVMEYEFPENGGRLAYAVSSEDGSTDGVYVLELGAGEETAVAAGEGEYKRLTFDEEGRQLAFLSNRDDYEADQPAFTLYHWRAGRAEARAVAGEGTAGIPEGWWVSEHGDLSFSENGERLFFGTAPRPEPEPEEETPEWEKVELDVWNWRDPLLQPQQLVERERELERTYLAVLRIGDRRVSQLADTTLPEVNVGDDGDADLALGYSDLPYRKRVSWDYPWYFDVYVVDVESGTRRKVLEALQGSQGYVDLSPEERYVTWWDGHERAWFAVPADGGEPVNLTAEVPYPVHDVEDDHPAIPYAYGSAGWTEDDGWFLVYDEHDIWAADPRGRRSARNLTEGVGRERDLEFRYLRLDPEQDALPEDEPMLLRAFDNQTKASGFYRDRFRGDARPAQLIMADRRFGYPRKADDADVVMLTRQSFQEFPDLWVGDLSFGDMQRVSDANPEMDEYLWGSAELVDWRSTDGTELEGILYKPEGFDPSRRYPMMVYFYERMSDGLHAFRGPGPGTSISISFYVSRGYLVFVPNVRYQVGYPGESALDCVVSGVLDLIDEGFVDPQRIGVQGHSWGGYQIAYLVTQTDIFAAAEAGAPVANMTSAYGGIRWASGLSRMFQYERSQSRLGGSLWDVRPRYIENSPLFWADKVETPVLMIHNDEDGAVPWYQGIEFFVALRRLNKPVWLLNYNGEPHGLRKYQNRKDWSIRMQQFFDHFLKDAPPPVWLAEGVPAVEKGRTLGLELIEEAAAAAVAEEGGGGAR